MLTPDWLNVKYESVQIRSAFNIIKTTTTSTKYASLLSDASARHVGL